MGCGTCCTQPTCCCTRKFAYLAGVVCLFIGIAMVTTGYFFVAWVHRIAGQGTIVTATSVEYYGLWQACSPSEFDTCWHIFDGMPEVEGGARGSQALITLGYILLTVCFVVEIASCSPCGLKNKWSVVFENRIIEYIISVATVLAFMGMLIFAAEVKNKAKREIGQEDYTGWGFGFSLAGQLFTVLGCCFLASGRDIGKCEQ